MNTHEYLLDYLEIIEDKCFTNETYYRYLFLPPYWIQKGRYICPSESFPNAKLFYPIGKTENPPFKEEGREIGVMFECVHSFERWWIHFASEAL